MKSDFLFHIMRIAKHRRAMLQHHFRGLDMTPLGAGILIDVQNHPDCSQDFLALNRMADKANVARTARALEERGLLQRVQDPGNRRQYMLRLTGAGAEAADQIRRLDEGYARYLVEELDEEERRTLETIIAKVSERASRFGEQGEDRE